MGSAEKATKIATNAFKHTSLFSIDLSEVDFTQLVAPLDSMEKEIETRNECHLYTQSDSGIVNENETIVEPDDAPRRPVESPNAPRRAEARE